MARCFSQLLASAANVFGCLTDQVFCFGLHEEYDEVPSWEGDGVCELVPQAARQLLGLAISARCDTIPFSAFLWIGFGSLSASLPLGILRQRWQSIWVSAPVANAKKLEWVLWVMYVLVFL
jgi:hypothetical protein